MQIKLIPVDFRDRGCDVISPDQKRVWIASVFIGIRCLRNDVGHMKMISPCVPAAVVAAAAAAAAAAAVAAAAAAAGVVLLLLQLLFLALTSVTW